jgi:hypothetical protein
VGIPGNPPRFPLIEHGNIREPENGQILEAKEDPIVKLKQLKDILDAGLISQEEYDKTKPRSWRRYDSDYPFEARQRCSSLPRISRQSLMK